MSDPTWRFVKYKGDIAIYAKCGCGFSFPCYKNKPRPTIGTDPYPEALYPYCPWCGSEKHSYTYYVQHIDKYRWED